MEAGFIGVDLGTTTCKSVIVNEKLEILGEDYVEYPLIINSGGFIEQDANTWWKLVMSTMKNAILRSGVKTSYIKGISVSSQGIAFVPVDRNCKPLHNAISWLDTRSVIQKEAILGRFDEKQFFKIMGKKVNEGYVLPKLLWLNENRKEIYANTYKFLMPHDFIVEKLCEEIVTDHSMASGTLCYDINKHAWASDIIDIFGIDEKKLPAVKWGGTAAGKLKKDVAQEVGLSTDVIVSVGGQDQKCAALGAGIRERNATVSLGTATAIIQRCKNPVIDEAMRITCSCDVVKNSWVLEGAIGTSCVCLKWFKDTFLPEKSYRDLDEMVEEVADLKNSIYFLPFFSGSGTPFCDNDIKGLFYGITLSTGKNDMVKSIFEGIACQIKANIDVMQELHEPIEELSVFGGGSKSDIWCQIISNVTNKSVVNLYTPETASIGAAILAGIGCGFYKNESEACGFIKIRRTVYPEKVKAGYYQEKFEKYLNLVKRLINGISEGTNR